MPAVPTLLTSLPFLNFSWFSKYSILALMSWRTVSAFDSCFAFSSSLGLKQSAHCSTEKLRPSFSHRSATDMYFSLSSSNSWFFLRYSLEADSKLWVSLFQHL